MHTLPIFVCRISRSKIKERFKSVRREEPTLGFAAFDKRWKNQNIFDEINKQSDFNSFFSHNSKQMSHRKFRSDSVRTDSTEDGFIDDLYDQSQSTQTKILGTSKKSQKILENSRESSKILGSPRKSQEILRNYRGPYKQYLFSIFAAYRPL